MRFALALSLYKIYLSFGKNFILKNEIIVDWGNGRNENSAG
jgi:hypothetical protein